MSKRMEGTGQPRVAFSLSEIARRCGCCTRTVEARLVRKEISPDVVVMTGAEGKGIPGFYKENIDQVMKQIE